MVVGAGVCGSGGSDCGLVLVVRVVLEGVVVMVVGWVGFIELEKSFFCQFRYLDKKIYWQKKWRIQPTIGPLLPV